MAPQPESKKVRADDRPGESEAERLDRNYNELLQEMRVLQAGVQILFAFLLTLPFQSAFGSVDDFQKTIYLSTLTSATLAVICVIGPVPFHRFVFRRGMKDDLIQATTRYVGAGLVFIFAAMIGAVLLVVDVLVSRAWALTMVGSLAAVFIALWLIVPVTARIREPNSAQDKPG